MENRYDDTYVEGASRVGGGEDLTRRTCFAMLRPEVSTLAHSNLLLNLVLQVNCCDKIEWNGLDLLCFS